MLSAAHYNAFGKPVSASLGNGLTEQWLYTPRGWPMSFAVGNPETPGAQATGTVSFNGSEQSVKNCPNPLQPNNCTTIYDGGSMWVYIGPSAYSVGWTVSDT